MKVPVYVLLLASSCLDGAFTQDVVVTKRIATGSCVFDGGLLASSTSIPSPTSEYQSPGYISSSYTLQVTGDVSIATTASSSTSESRTSTTRSLIYPSVPTFSPTQFLLTFRVISRGRKRQITLSDRFITPSGQATANCLSTEVYNLSPIGQLSIERGSLVYGTSLGVSPAVFKPEKNPGNITTAWNITDRVVKFNNPSFHNGSASYCLEYSSYTIWAYYFTPPPGECEPVQLRNTPLYGCQELTGVEDPNLEAPSNVSANATGTFMPPMASGYNSSTSSKPSYPVVTSRPQSSSTGAFFPANTTRPTPACLNDTTFAVPDPPNGTTCGLDGLLDFNWRLRWPTILSDCAFTCLNDAECLSFNFIPTEKTCFTSLYPLKNATNVDKQSYQMLNYDRACYALAC